MDIPIPQEVMSQMKENELLIKNWQESKKLKERLHTLLRRLEVCKEAKPVLRENLEAHRAVAYHQSVLDQIGKKLEEAQISLSSLQNKHENNLESMKRRHQKELETLENNHTFSLNLEQQRVTKHQDNFNYITSRKNIAEERSKTGISSETKEEIALKKESLELYAKYSALQPIDDLKKVFPTFDSVVLNKNNPPPPPTPLSPSPPPPPTTPPFSSETPRPLKQLVEEKEKNPLANLSEKQMNSMTPKDLLELARQMKQPSNPYANVIQYASKVKRKPKQTDDQLAIEN